MVVCILVLVYHILCLVCFSYFVFACSFLVIYIFVTGKKNYFFFFSKMSGQEFIIEHLFCSFRPFKIGRCLVWFVIKLQGTYLKIFLFFSFSDIVILPWTSWALVNIIMKCFLFHVLRILLMHVCLSCYLTQKFEQNAL